MDKKSLYAKKRDKLVYCFDIDGTITVETEGWDYAVRTPKRDMIHHINKLYIGGQHEIVLWTSRLEIDETVTREWLMKHGVLFHELVFGKPFFDKYICDKAVNAHYYREKLC